ncbi:MAG: prepilin-type N-terminal cleavage/methylation domain-containing protein [Desulfobacter postgatei]|uniref:PilW family protein n=1 Tax=Desulfobacter postgatei TaxID=2293 RepID=UPI0023F25FDE|nr:prepilin-type N-terminal cleavage/methylation domain-containing protein [Desulfobacter postgatei]MDD4274813.1 prepilin-type N-terminal cleavage/methylation domain-containing protein [Desulfobacter postgatei]
MKSTIKNINQIQNFKGFTLVELLVAVAISSIALLLVTQVFISTNKMNTIQENVASVQQDIRAAMDIMSTDIMMAGLNPHDPPATDAGFADDVDDKYDTDSNSIALKYDYDGDGACEIDRRYYYDSAKQCLMIRNGAVAQPLTADDTITTVNFSYTLADGSIDPDPSTNSNRDDIRLVTVQICGKITGTYAADHPNIYCFSRNIKPRNL